SCPRPRHFNESSPGQLADGAIGLQNRDTSARHSAAGTDMVLSATTIDGLTVPEKILLGAHALEEAGQSPFSAEALIVSAWQKFPQAFGLKGYAEQYPDSNKILSSIMGEKGLAKRGWLAKMGQKMYSLSRDGKQVVRRL